jgi:hypothetical protein
MCPPTVPPASRAFARGRLCRVRHFINAANLTDLFDVKEKQEGEVKPSIDGFDCQAPSEFWFFLDRGGQHLCFANSGEASIWVVNKFYTQTGNNTGYFLFNSGYRVDLLDGVPVVVLSFSGSQPIDTARPAKAQLPRFTFTRDDHRLVRTQLWLQAVASSGEKAGEGVSEQRITYMLAPAEQYPDAFFSADTITQP